MAINLWIPRLEFNDVPFTGDVHSGSDTIDNIDDTTGLREGMIAKGPGIPGGSKIITIDVDSIILDQDATTDVDAGSLAAFIRFDFQFPPSKDTNVTYKPVNSVIDSLSGKRQVQTNYVEATKQLEHWFLNQADAAILESDFYLSWAAMGCKFRYFPDKDDSTFLDVSLDKPHTFDKPRQVKKHPDFLYKIPMTLRWVIAIPTRVGGHLLTEGGDTITTEDGDNISL